MDMLQVRDGKIVNEKGEAVRLRGTGVGGWMNMENFINGYPGVEQGIRAAVRDVLGRKKARFFFERWLDYFLAEEDIAFISECGANVVRLPLNYRHFESDEEPFRYLEKGFERLERAVKWCATHGLYVILDLHSVQGWQNTDWHCDNPTRHSLFWKHPYFRDRFISLWEAFADKFKTEPVIAGYNIMNEPVTNSILSRYNNDDHPNWKMLNQIYHRTVNAIRSIDEKHIIFLEGDLFSNLFEGLDAPFDDNLVYSSHNYIPPCMGPGAYPGEIRGEYWKKDKIREEFVSRQGWEFTQKHNVPLWVGEFGCVFNGQPGEIPHRLKALEDQIDIFEELGVHWTTWTYKDIGVMGWARVHPESEYMKKIEPIQEAKRLLNVDLWTSWMTSTRTKEIIGRLCRHVESVLEDPDIEASTNEHFMSQVALSGYLSGLMQPIWAKRFAGMSEEDIDRVLQSFALKNCHKGTGLIEALKKNMTRPAG